MKVLIIFFLGSLLSQARAYSPEATCLIAQSGTFIADPSNCNGYIYCLNGAVSYAGTCGAGLRYNSYTGQCDYENNVQCKFGSSACEGLTNVYINDINNCNAYIYCDAKSQVTTNNCPAGQAFDLDSVSCVWQSQQACSGSPCDLVANNNFLADNSSTATAASYIVCSNGNAVYGQKCGDGLEFDSLQGACVMGVTPISCDSTFASAVDSTDTSKGYFIASPTNCNQYYFCETNTAASTPTTLYCPTRFHFNAAKNTCQVSYSYYPTGANENCDRCGGFGADQFAAVLSSKNGCKNYYFCNGNGGKVQASAGACPSTYPYFNEQTQSCAGTALGTDLCPTA